MSFIQLTHRSGRTVMVNRDNILYAYNKPGRTVVLKTVTNEDIPVTETAAEVRALLLAP